MIIGQQRWRNRQWKVAAFSVTALLIFIFATSIVSWPVARGNHSSDESDDFDEMFRQLLTDELGPVASRSLYCLLMLPATALTFDDSTGVSSFGELVENWTDHVSEGYRRRASEDLPPSQCSTSGRLLLLKKTTSIAVGRIHRDSLLRSLYRRQSVSSERILIVNQIRRVIRALTMHFFIGLQMIIDVIQEEDVFHRSLYERKPWEQFDVDEDPLLLLMSQLDHKSSEEDVVKLISRIRSGDFLVDAIPAKRTDSAAYVRMHSVEYHRTHIIRSFPGVGKFWSYFRPIASCSSTVRSCENPEGCRFVCNPMYLTLGSRRDGTVFDHRLVGFGSNNHFDWEESMARMLTAGARSSMLRPSSTSARRPQRPNGVRSLLTLDCTVSDWSIPESLRSVPNFMTSRICIGKRASNATIAIDDLKPFVLDAENAKNQHCEMQGKHLAFTNMRSLEYDQLAVLKLDVEGHEHTVMPAWAKLELRDLKHSLGRHFAQEVNGQIGLTVIDFERDIPSFFTTSMVQLELHEFVGGSPPSYEYSALQAFRVQQYLASLGFVQIAQERNAMSDCCFELLYVHYRYLIQSEVWLHSLQ